MSTLILQLPARPRGVRAPAGDATEASRAESIQAALRERIGEDISYVLSQDGITAQRQGRCAPDMLPRADGVVAVLPADELSWHRLALPKASGARLQAALAGILEEALLDDVADIHFAVQAGAKPGETAWVAACRRDFLVQRLEQLEKSRIRIDRVVPSVWPDEPPSGYFSAAEDAAEDGPGMLLSWSTRDGVVNAPVKGGAVRQLMPDPLPEGARFFATPAVAAPAERWLGVPVTLQTEAEHLLQSARSLWDLRQFDLAPSHRGLDVVTESLRRFMGPHWRPARVGLGVLVAAQVLGLNAWAWELRHAVQARQESMASLLRSAHPDVQAVLDAPAQMRRANEALRAAAGRPGDDDLEPLLSVAASAWPPGQPVQALQFEPGTLTFSVADWSPGQVQALRGALEGAGLRVETVEGRLTLSRGRTSAGGS